METVNLWSERYFFFYQSWDYISYLPWTGEYSLAETCVIWQCFGCQPLGYFHSVVVFLRSEVKRCEAKRSTAITISFEIFRSHTLNWINIIVLRILQNYSCGLLRVIYLSEKTVKQVTWCFCYLPGYLENCVYLPIVFFALGGWLSTWNSWVFGNLYWCYWLTEECSFSLENLNCSWLDLRLKRGERVKSAGFLIFCLSCRFVWNSSFNLFSSKLLNSTLSRAHHISGP